MHKCINLFVVAAFAAAFDFAGVVVVVADAAVVVDVAPAAVGVSAVVAADSSALSVCC